MIQTIMISIFVFFIAGDISAKENYGMMITKKNNDENATFVDTNKRYSIKYPNDWTKDETLKEFDLFIMAPKDSIGRSVANVSIISMTLPKEYFLDNYYDENIKELLKENPSIVIKKQGSTVIDDAPVKWIRYTRENDQTEIMQYFFVVKGNAYLITLGGTKEDFADHQEIFDKITNSFRFL